MKSLQAPFSILKSWRLVVGSFSFIFAIPLASPGDTQFYLEPELGLFTGVYRSQNEMKIWGLQSGLSVGAQWERYQAGIEVSGRFFQPEVSGEVVNHTNIPIGISFRVKISEDFRLLAAWYWDDVLYKDFYFKFQKGFKIPKDYDLAYEGPGSWRIGLSHQLASNLYLNHTIFPQTFRSYKRRHPVEVIGGLDPLVVMLTYAATVSFLF